MLGQILPRVGFEPTLPRPQPENKILIWKDFQASAEPPCGSRSRRGRVDEPEQVHSRAGGQDFLTSFLDRDDDGSVMDDALEMGAGC